MARACNDPRAGSDMKYMTRHTSTFILSRSWIQTQNVPLNMGKIYSIFAIFLFIILPNHIFSLFVAGRSCIYVFSFFCVVRLSDTEAAFTWSWCTSGQQRFRQAEKKRRDRSICRMSTLPPICRPSILITWHNVSILSFYSVGAETVFEML